MSSFTDTKEREKTVDFVTYFTAGTSFYVKAQGGPAINGLADLCGHKVAVEKGTTQQDDSTAQDKKCKAAGKKGVSVSVFPDQNSANLALSSGRADVGMSDSPVAEYQVKKSNGQFKVVGQAYGTAPFGIAMPKGSGLDKAVLAGVKALIANGQYKSSLDKWGIRPGRDHQPHDQRGHELGARACRRPAPPSRRTPGGPRRSGPSRCATPAAGSRRPRGAAGGDRRPLGGHQPAVRVGHRSATGSSTAGSCTASWSPSS